MALPETRSCVAELRLGTTEGTYKSFAKDRGGSQVEDDHLLLVRKQMSGAWHGFNEAPTRITPTGDQFTSLTYRDVTPKDVENI